MSERNDPALVIVVPTKNRRALLERALESISSQHYSQYRVVVIDDASTDETQEFLATLLAKKSFSLQVVRHEQSRGVNAARNAAFSQLRTGEWAVTLDDDDKLLPNALHTIADSIREAPADIQILAFNTITAFSSGEKETGRIFSEGEVWHDPTYYEFFVDPKSDGDLRLVFRADLFPRYLFAEDINGFEGEWSLRIARDGVPMRMFPARTIWIDALHTGEHLSHVAAKRNPASFVRAHTRIFHDHWQFFNEHPELARERAIAAGKLSIRSINPIAAIRFAYYCCYFSLIPASRPR